MIEITKLVLSVQFIQSENGQPKKTKIFYVREKIKKKPTSLALVTEGKVSPIQTDHRFQSHKIPDCDTTYTYKFWITYQWTILICMKDVN